jgi:hypothetical protein
MKIDVEPSLLNVTMAALRGEAVAYGKGHALPPRFRATVTRAEGDPENVPDHLEASFEVREGRVRCVGLDLTLERDFDHPVTSANLRLPVTVMTKTITAIAAVEVDMSSQPGTVAVSVATDLSALSEPRGNYHLDDQHLRKVAKVYRAAIRAKRSDPRNAIVAEFAVSRPTAGRWTQMARERGFLPPTEPRKAKA